MNFEGNNTIKKAETSPDGLVKKTIMGLVEIGGLNYEGDNLVQVLYLRMVKEMTLQEIADILGTTLEPVRQMQELALRRLVSSGKISQKERDRIKVFLRRNRPPQNLPFSPKDLVDYISSNN